MTGEPAKIFRGFGIDPLSKILAVKVSKYSHSIATANLNKSEDFVTNTTTASKYIPGRPRISIN